MSDDVSPSTDISRRTLLGTAAAGAAAAGAASLGGVDAAADAAQPHGGHDPRGAHGGRHGDLRDIKRVMVVMQENRSFDHYFGTLKGVRGFADRSVPPQHDGSPVWEQPTGRPGTTTADHFPWTLSKDVTYQGHVPPDAEDGAQNYNGTSHSWDDQHAAWYGGWMNGWWWAKGGPTTLGYLTRDDIPWHYALADTYTIGDAYHCSVLSATGPNRTYLWSGTVNASQDHNGSTYVAYSGGDESGLTWQTYAEDLEAAGVTWRLYNCQDNYGDNGLQYFARFAKNSGDFSNPNNDPLWNQAIKPVSTDTGQTMSNADDLIAAVKNDVVAGTLPQVSWVVSNQTFSEHPDGAAINGSYLLNGLLNALAADEETFNSTLVILNYDENDGQFDHVPPPVAPAGTKDEYYAEASGTLATLGFGEMPVGLGFRVPLVLVSPWTRGGWVYSATSDHTSVIQFLEKWTAAQGKPAISPNISAWRRTLCDDLTGAFDFANPVFGLPDLGVSAGSPIPDPAGGAYVPQPTVNQMPAQEAGSKPARALPYQPDATFALGAAGATLTFTNVAEFAAKAAHFSVYDPKTSSIDPATYPVGFPGHYTVSPGRKESATAAVSGPYDVTVLGPNRFLRRFTGDATAAGAGVETTTEYRFEGRGRSQQLLVTVKNPTKRPVRVTLTPTAYTTKAVSFEVPAGRSRTEELPLARSHGWYDLTATIDTDSTWSRRLAGHVENGNDSVTG